MNSKYDSFEKLPPVYSDEDITDHCSVILQSEEPVGCCGIGMRRVYLVNTIPEIVSLISVLPKESAIQMPDDYDGDIDDFTNKVSKKYLSKLKSLEKKTGPEISKKNISSITEIISDFNNAVFVGIMNTDCISDSTFTFEGQLRDYLHHAENTEDFFDALDSALNSDELVEEDLEEKIANKNENEKSFHLPGDEDLIALAINSINDGRADTF